MGLTCDVLTIPEVLRRAKAEGLPLSEYSLRRLIKSGNIPARFLGTKALVSYGAILRYLSCVDGCDNAPPATTGSTTSVRRIDAR